jgi:hypothetical protein
VTGDLRAIFGVASERGLKGRAGTTERLRAICPMPVRLNCKDVREMQAEGKDAKRTPDAGAMPLITVNCKDVCEMQAEGEKT